MKFSPPDLQALETIQKERKKMAQLFTEPRLNRSEMHESEQRLIKISREVNRNLTVAFESLPERLTLTLPPSGLAYHMNLYLGTVFLHGRELYAIERCQEEHAQLLFGRHPMHVTNIHARYDNLHASISADALPLIISMLTTTGSVWNMKKLPYQREMVFSHEEMDDVESRITYHANGVRILTPTPREAAAGDPPFTLGQHDHIITPGMHHPPSGGKKALHWTLYEDVEKAAKEFNQNNTLQKISEEQVRTYLNAVINGDKSFGPLLDMMKELAPHSPITKIVDEMSAENPFLLSILEQMENR